ELCHFDRMIREPQQGPQNRIHVVIDRVDDAAVNEPPRNLIVAQTACRLSYVAVQNRSGCIIEWVGHRILGMQPFQPILFEPKVSKDRGCCTKGVGGRTQIDNRTIPENICRCGGTTDPVIAFKDTYVPAGPSQHGCCGKPIWPGAHNICLWSSRDRHGGSSDVTGCDDEQLFCPNVS